MQGPEPRCSLMETSGLHGERDGACLQPCLCHSWCCPLAWPAVPALCGGGLAACGRGCAMSFVGCLSDRSLGGHPVLLHSHPRAMSPLRLWHLDALPYCLPRELLWVPLDPAAGDDAGQPCGPQLIAQCGCEVGPRGAGVLQTQGWQGWGCPLPP